MRIARAASTVFFLFLFFVFSSPSQAHAQSQGRLQGTITKDGQGLGGVVVLVNELALSTLTDPRGRFSIADVAAGVYSVTLALGTHAMTETGVRVTGGETTLFDRSVTWDVGFADTITVVSASRRRERIVDAPGAVTAVQPDTLALQGASGQVPRMVAASVGVELTQNGLYDFNLNTRGFNGFLTRRIQTIVDGRDPSIPGTSSQEWWTIDALADDIETMELARGPSAALYGPNSFNGVLNVISRSPRDSQGLVARISGGDLATFKANVRWAGPAGDGWFVKALAAHTRSDDFAVSRVTGTEYAGLPAEIVPLSEDPLRLTSGALRADRYFAGDGVLVIEGGLAQGDGQVSMTSAGRAQQRDITRSWARAAFFAPYWNVTGAANRCTGDSLLLGANAALLEQGTSLTVDGQIHRLWQSRGVRAVGGFSLAHKRLDSADDAGVQTLYAERVTSNQGALFGQVDWEPNGVVKVVAASRWDESDLHPAQFSPKAAVVFTLRPGQTVRAGYNRAFQVANYTELFASVPAAPPIDLSALEAAFAPVLGGVSLGFSSVPILVRGNRALDVEQIRALELGYSGVLGARALLRVDYYYERVKDFISGYLPGANPAFGPYRAPDSLPAPVAAAFEAAANGAVPGLTTLPGGAPAVVLSPGNSGRVSSQGLELSLDYFVNNRWRLSASYARLAHDVLESSPGAEVYFNAPSRRFSAGATFAHRQFAGDVSLRWQGDFDWVSGVFAGPVPSFTVVDVNVRYDLSARWQLGGTIGNLFNSRHYEAFGADRLRRHALVHLTWRKGV